MVSESILTRFLDLSSHPLFDCYRTILKYVNYIIS